MLCQSCRFNFKKRCISPKVGHYPLGGLNEVSIEYSWHDKHMCNEGNAFAHKVVRVKQEKFITSLYPKGVV